MSELRENLQRALWQYSKDTLSHIDTVRGFCASLSTWTAARKTERTKMTKDINEQELAAVVKDTQRGLEKLDCFLDAVENLAVTSVYVFTVENPVLHLPEGIRPEHVQVVIFAAHIICPLLLEFKRDASVFFLPRHQNVEVLSYQLNKYIQTTQNICGTLEKSSLSNFCMKMNDKTLVDLDVDLSEDDVQSMLCHINELDEIRKNKNFRTVFLFQGEHSGFMTEFKKRHPRMLQSLTDLEENAVQLDKMNLGAKISSVAGSSVGAVGGVLSIVGLALIPFTAGLSLGLTMTGLGMGITSGVNSAVTTATEIGVNRKHQKKASEIFQSFMEDMQSIQDCLALGVGKVLCKGGAIGGSMESVLDFSSVNKELGKALGNLSMVAADIPDIGQAAVKGPLALSKTARAGFIGLNALFLGMDVFFICKDSISLANGSETEFLQFIRARATLWCSEMDSWQKIYDFLCKGLLTSEENKTILKTPFIQRRRSRDKR